MFVSLSSGRLLSGASDSLFNHRVILADGFPDEVADHGGVDCDERDLRTLR
jgi:hypothetical protein